MKTFDLKGVERKEVGKKSTRELRANEQVPCVLYGLDTNIHFAVEEKALINLIYTPNVYIINVDIDGTVRQAVMQDLQFHPVTDKVEHIDFLLLNAEKPVNISIPVKLEGLAEGVTQGGKLMLKTRTLKVKGLAKDFPDTLNIDVTNLTLGKSIKVGDCSFDNLQLLDNKSTVVATVRLTRSAMSAAADEEQPEEAAAATEE